MRRLLVIPLLAALGGGACSEGTDAPKAPVDAGSPLPATGAGAAKLTALTGTVTLTRKGAAPQSATKGELAVGDVVETGADGDATVRFGDGHEVQLGANGRFEINNGDDGLVLNVGQGLVLSRVVNDVPVDKNAMKLAILTPYGLVRLGSSEVKVGVGGDDAKVDVVTGNVQIVSRGGDTVSVTAGDLSVLSREGVKTGTREVRLEPLQIELSGISGRVDYKKKDDKAFSPVNARKLPELAEGDALRVQQGSATVTPKGSGAKVTLTSNTEVGLGQVQTGSGIEDVALDLRKGALTVSMPQGTKRRLHPGDGYTLSVNDGAQFTIVRSKNGLDLNTVVGEVLVEHDGMSATAVRGAQNSLLAKGNVTVKDVAKETFTLPSRPGVRLFHPNIGAAALTWPGEVGNTYRVVVGYEPSLASPFIDGTLKQPWLNVAIPARGSLFWKVFEGEKEIAKGSFSAAPERNNGELGRLRNEVPDGAEKTVIYYQDKPPSVTFMWKAVDPAPAEYRLQVYREGALGKPIEERDAKATTVQLPENALGEGSYVWSVTPLDAKGQALQGGRMNKLEMVYDNAVAELVIKSPRNGDPATAQVNAVGIAPLKTKVSINGQSVALDEKARFNTKVAPVGGRVVFHTLGEGGEQFTVRVLRRGK